MTNREFYTAIASNETLSADLIEFASNAIAKLDATNEKRKNTPSKTAIANAPIVESILNVLTSESQTAMDVAGKVGISTQKASALLRQIVADGKASVMDVKVPKKGVVKAYALVEAAE